MRCASFTPPVAAVDEVAPGERVAQGMRDAAAAPRVVDGVEVTILEAVFARSIDEFQKPADGYVYVGYRLRLRATEGTTVVTVGDWTALADGSRQGEWTIVVHDKWEPTMSFTELRAGATTEGWMAFEVPEPTSFVRLIYDPSFLGDEVRLQLDTQCCE